MKNIISILKYHFCRCIFIWLFSNINSKIVCIVLSYDLFFLGSSMFLVPIKLQPSKFSLYLILIAFLIPTKKKLLIILVPAKTNFV